VLAQAGEQEPLVGLTRGAGGCYGFNQGVVTRLGGFSQRGIEQDVYVLTVPALALRRSGIAQLINQAVGRAEFVLLALDEGTQTCSFVSASRGLRRPAKRLRCACNRVARLFH